MTETCSAVPWTKRGHTAQVSSPKTGQTQRPETEQPKIKARTRATTARLTTPAVAGTYSRQLSIIYRLSCSSTRNRWHARHILGKKNNQHVTGRLFQTIFSPPKSSHRLIRQHLPHVERRRTHRSPPYPASTSAPGPAPRRTFCVWAPTGRRHPTAIAPHNSLSGGRHTARSRGQPRPLRQPTPGASPRKGSPVEALGERARLHAAALTRSLDSAADGGGC